MHNFHEALLTLKLLLFKESHHILQNVTFSKASSACPLLLALKQARPRDIDISSLLCMAWWLYPMPSLSCDTISAFLRFCSAL